MTRRTLARRHGQLRFNAALEFAPFASWEIPEPFAMPLPSDLCFRRCDQQLPFAIPATAIELSGYQGSH